MILARRDIPRRLAPEGLELWSDAAMLSHLSPFLHDLPESKAVPASHRKAKRARTDSIVKVSNLDVVAALDDDEMDDDSDAETENYLVNVEETPLYQAAELRGEFPY